MRATLELHYSPYVNGRRSVQVSVIETNSDDWKALEAIALRKVVDGGINCREAILVELDDSAQDCVNPQRRTEFRVHRIHHTGALLDVERIRTVSDYVGGWELSKK